MYFSEYELQYSEMVFWLVLYSGLVLQGNLYLLSLCLWLPFLSSKPLPDLQNKKIYFKNGREVPMAL